MPSSAARPAQRKESYVFKNKSAAKEGQDFHVVYASPAAPGFDTPATETQALEAFRMCVALGHITPDNGRHLKVIGPKHCVQAHSVVDPLPDPDAALRAVLTEAEYTAVSYRAGGR